MNQELTALETLKTLKDFVLEKNKNNLDRSFINGAFDIIEEALKDYYKIKEIEEHYHLDDYTKEVKHKKTFAEYLEEYYSKHSLKSDKKKRVIVSDGRVIF